MTKSSNVVRYYGTKNGSHRRIVEYRKRKRVSTGSGRLDYEYKQERRWLTIEEFDGNSWNEIEELGDYIEPKDAPDE